MSLDKRIAVLVTGVSQNSVGFQIVKSLFLQNHLYKVIGTNVKSAEVNHDERYIFEKLTHSSSSDYLLRLLEIAKKYEVRAIFPGSEDELKVISKEAKIIEENGITPIVLDYKVVNQCLNKNSLTKALVHLDIPHPDSLVIDANTNLNSIKIFPLVLKPEQGSGSKGVVIIQSKEELQLLTPIWLKNYGALIAQEYIDSSAGEYTVGVLTDPFDGSVRNSIILKRQIMDGIGHGSMVTNSYIGNIKEPFLVLSSGISQGIFIKNESISSQVENAVLKLGIKGAVNVQCRIQEGIVKIFEINPRLSGTTYGRALCGFNEPHLLLQRILNKVPIQYRFPYKLGFYARNIQDEIILI